ALQFALKDLVVFLVETLLKIFVSADDLLDFGLAVAVALLAVTGRKRHIAELVAAHLGSPRHEGGIVAEASAIRQPRFRPFAAKARNALQEPARKLSVRLVFAMRPILAERIFNGFRGFLVLRGALGFHRLHRLDVP